MLAQQRRLIGQIDKRGLWQYAVVVMAGLLLGVWVPLFFYLPQDIAMVGTAAIIGLLGLMVAGNLQMLFVLVLVIDLALNVDVNVGFRYEFDTFNNLAGWPLSITTVALAILFILKLGEKQSRATIRPSLTWYEASLPLLVYVAANLLSTLAAEDLSLAFMRVSLLVQALLMYVYLISFVNRWEMIRVIILGIMGVVILESLLVIIQFVTGFTIEIGLLSFYGTQTRPGGTVGHPNITSSFLATLLVPVISIFFTSMPRFYKQLAMGTVPVGLVALLLTLSRGGWVAFVVGLSFFLFVAFWRGWLKLGTVVVLILIAGIILAISAPIIMARLFGDDSGAAESRVPLMELAVKMILDHPIIGVGTNNFFYGMRPYLSVGEIDFYAAVHNKILLTWAETGTIGVLALIWFLGSVFVRGLRRSSENDPLLSPLVLGLTAALVGYSTHMMVDTFHTRMSVQLLMLVAGLITAISLWIRSPEEVSVVRPRREAMRHVRRGPSPRKRVIMTEQQLYLAAPPQTSLRKVASNVVSLLASDVVNRATTFIQYALVGRYLGTHEFGQMSVALAVFYPAQVFASAGLKTLVTREVAKDRTKTEKYLVNASAAVFVTSLITLAAVIAFVILMGYARDTAILIVVMAAGILPYAVASVCEGIFQGWEQMRFIAYANMPANVFKVIGTVTVLSLGAGLPGLILLLVGTYATLSILEWFFMLRNIIRPRLRIDPEFMVSMLKQTSTFLGIDGILAITASLSVILLSGVQSEETAGLFSSANQLMVPVTLIYVSIVVSFFPMMCRRFDPSSFDGLAKITENLLELLLAIVIPAVVGLMFVSDWALLLLYGEEDFLQATPALRIMVWNLVLVAFTSVLGQVLIASGRERVTLRIVMVDSVVSLVAGYILISEFGLVGAAMAGVAVKSVDLIQHVAPVSKLLSGIPFVKLLWKPVIASAAMGLFLYVTQDSTNFLTVGVGAMIYGAIWLALALASTGSPRDLKNKYSYLWTD